MMKWEQTNKGYTFTRENGEEINLSWMEINFIEHELERETWRGEILEAIEIDEDSLDFSKMTKDEFVDECMGYLDSRYEEGSSCRNMDYADLIFDMAQDLDVWKE